MGSLDCCHQISCPMCTPQAPPTLYWFATIKRGQYILKKQAIVYSALLIVAGSIQCIQFLSHWFVLQTWQAGRQAGRQALWHWLVQNRREQYNNVLPHVTKGRCTYWIQYIPLSKPIMYICNKSSLGTRLLWIKPMKRVFSSHVDLSMLFISSKLFPSSFLLLSVIWH